MADITSGDGKNIKKEYTVRGVKPVDSEWEWPTEQPCFKDFGNWKKAIQILNENNVLLDSLGRCLAQPYFKWHWYYEAQSESVVYKNEGQAVIYEKGRTTTRTNQVYFKSDDRYEGGYKLYYTAVLKISDNVVVCEGKGITLTSRMNYHQQRR